MTEKEGRGLAGTAGASGNQQASAPPAPPQQYQYGTFQGVPYHNPPPPSQSASHQQPVVGFPQPIPPPGLGYSSATHHYPHGYQSVPGYVVAEGRPVNQPRLPCCGIGIGWFLFIAGFFLAAIPWYIGALILLCGRVDYREKPGLVVCAIASILAVVAIIFVVSEGNHHHHHW